MTGHGGSPPLSPEEVREVREVAVRLASVERTPWVLPWRDVADRIEVSLETTHDPEVYEVRMWLPIDGIASAFHLPLDPAFPVSKQIEVELCRRIGDLAAEPWRDESKR